MMKDLPKWAALLLLIVGILFLIKDYATTSMEWWKVSWYTALFVIFGLAALIKNK